MISTDILTKDELDHVIKSQMNTHLNIEIRPVKEILREFPMKAIKSVGISTSLGSFMTLCSSLYVFRDFRMVGKDMKVAVPALLQYSTIDFSINYGLTKAFKKRRPERWMCVTSSGIAGSYIGWHYGKRAPTTIFGGVMGAIYGYVRNTPLTMFGFDPY